MERGDAQGASRGPIPGRRQDRRRLPVELTGLLDRKLEQGLDHVVRRRILRALHAAEDALSPAQLSDDGGELSDVALSTVAYHMKTLLKYRMVREDRTESARGALEHFFLSEVVTDPVVLSVLAQTEELDHPKRTGGREG
jgi:DNA-binding transcriptional ArsR family regulator